MPSIDAIVREWQERRSPVMTARTVATNVAPIRIISKWFGPCEPRTIALQTVEDFRNSLLNEGLSKITVARYLSVLRAAGGEHLAHLSIGKLISELKREPMQVDCWTREEVRKIIEVACDAESVGMFCFVRFLFASGCRRGEALALEKEDIDCTRNRIHIHRSLTLDGSSQNGTKWGGERWFPMSNELHAIVYDPKPGSHLVFPSLDQRQVGRQFNRVRDAAGVRPFKLHCTRHTAISWALASGMSLRKASEIFGVSQATLEKHYAHFVDEEVSMEWANL